MKNPLYKRLPRELKKNFGKYLALFLFLMITIGFGSGFFIAGSSMKVAFENSFEKYNIEDGHFTLADKASDTLIEETEKLGLTIYELFYKDKILDDGDTVRVYQIRDEINLIDVMQGDMPSKENELAIDRLYCEYNDLSIGDTIKIDGKDFRITALVALSDYTSLFKNNSDLMFDAELFTPVIVTKESFQNLSDSGLEYNYAWIDDRQNMTDPEKKDRAEEIQKTIVKYGILTEFIPEFANQAIHFAGDDIGGDRVIMQWLLYIIILVIGLAAAITTKSTVEQESAVIGTLRASGYKRSELLWHYVIVPVLVTLAAALAGNVLGYTFMKDFCVGMYYHSYSLMSYQTLWNGEAFILTTVIPCIMILILNLVILGTMLSLPPLQFLRKELKRKKKSKTLKLRHGSFFARFRTRVIMQNISAYILLLAGIFVANVMLVFGFLFMPLVQNYKEIIINSQIAEYQYILKAPVETETKGAEKFSVYTLQNDNEETITVYGIEENSKYLQNLDLTDGKIYLSDSYKEKYGLDSGDIITLSEKYEEKSYDFKVESEYEYPSSLCIFMSREKFSDVFDKDENYFSGYFSNEKIDDIDSLYIATVITQSDLTAASDQLENSMGMMSIIWVFATALYILMIYLLAKMITEKNAKSISLMKIMGYSNHEIGRLYNYSTGIVVLISMTVTLPLISFLIKKIYYIFMLEYNGWMTYYFAPWIYPLTVAIGCFSFLVVYFLEMKRIAKIPLSETIKGIE